MTRLCSEQRKKETKNETLLSVTANQKAKLLNGRLSEFLARLDFLVTFLAMKKVTHFHNGVASKTTGIRKNEENCYG